MPWGHPEAFESLWCIGCGHHGREFMQRRFLKGNPPPPTSRVRVCPPCFRQGTRLVGDGVEEGSFYLAGRNPAPRPTPAEDVA